jgi:hypothetical protein
MGATTRTRKAGAMDPQSPSEEMPSLYRAVLDTVWRLERLGERDFALLVRQRAVRTYATRWDDGGRKELVRINAEALRRLAVTIPAAGFSLETNPEIP